MILKQLAAAAAKSLQSCPTLCDPIDGSPPGSPVPGILQARTLEWQFLVILHSKSIQQVCMHGLTCVRSGHSQCKGLENVTFVLGQKEEET